MPSTGKTATVLEVVKELEESACDGDMPMFQFVHLNGLNLTNSQQVFQVILKVHVHMQVFACTLTHTHMHTYTRKNYTFAVTHYAATYWEEVVTSQCSRETQQALL